MHEVDALTPCLRLRVRNGEDGEIALLRARDPAVIAPLGCCLLYSHPSKEPQVSVTIIKDLRIDESPHSCLIAYGQGQHIWELPSILLKRKS